MRDSMAAVVVVLSLAACGNGEAVGAAAGEATAPAVPEVVIHVSGSYSGTFETTGSIFCKPDEFGGPQEEFELYAMEPPEQFNLKLPRNVEPGTYTMSSGAGAPFVFYYTDPQRVKYQEIESATIALDTVPQAQGERLIGTIQAVLQSRKGQSVQVDIRLDLDAGAQSFDECR